MDVSTEILLAPADGLEDHFLPFFQSGVYLTGRMGSGVRTFLVDHVHVSPAYIETRIQTVFLDGKAVDDLDSAVVRDGSTLTLSAAMPGLLGATLRLGSHYAAMRSQISHHAERGTVGPDEGRVLLKLFNLLIRELGPPLLRNGVWMPGRALGEFFEGRTGMFWNTCRTVELNGRPVDPEELMDMVWPDSLVMLRLGIE